MNTQISSILDSLSSTSSRPVRATRIYPEIFAERSKDIPRPPPYSEKDPIITSPDVACIIVCAGMDGALPSVISGLVKVPVIAVPTSVGYRYGSGGNAALGTMLNSCSPGVCVVNIDNGFGAASVAYKIVKGGEE